MAAAKERGWLYGLALSVIIASLILLVAGLALGQDWFRIAQLVLLFGYGILAVVIFGKVKGFSGRRWPFVIGGIWIAGLLAVGGTVLAAYAAATGNLAGATGGGVTAVGGCAIAGYIAWDQHRRDRAGRENGPKPPA